MKKKSKQREELMVVVRNLNNVSKQLSNITEDVGLLVAKSSNPVRVGDADSDLSIKKVIEDEEKRTVVIIWDDGTVTKSVADPKDEFDFNVGFGLCIAKKFVHNINNYAEAIKKSKTRYVKVTKKEKGK